MKFYALTALLMAGTLFSAHAATVTVYKSVGKHGEVRFTQMQPTDTKNFTVLQLRSDGRITDEGKATQTPAETANTNPDAQRAAELEKQLKEQQNQERARACQNLRTNLANLAIGGRVFETNAQGERVYLNDQEINSRRQRHQEMIDQHCQGV